MKYIIGAYASAPSLISNDKLLESQFYNKLIKFIPQIKGLEIPFFGEDIHKFGSDFLFNFISPDWDNVLTCIPGTMKYLEKNPKFGLASDNALGRKEAIAMYARANNILHVMNEKYGKKAFFAVQIVTAPSMSVAGVSASTKSLLKSLDEILRWDWGGAKIVIEHCDRFIPSQPCEKGFLSIENEIDTLLKISSSYNVGITINWARSAIEERNTIAPINHLKLVNKSNLLSGLIFSGTSKNDPLYGKWKDNHMPFSFSDSFDNHEINSLLNFKNVSQTLSCIDVNRIDYLGVKLLSMPIDNFDLDKRVGINFEAISALDKILTM
jgi:hypothetical protein